jgi:PAS domain S-box-containing protein
MSEIIEAGRHGNSQAVPLRILLALEEATREEQVAQSLLDRLPCQVERAAGREVIAALTDAIVPFQVLLSEGSLICGREKIEQIRQLEQAPEIVVLTESSPASTLDLLRAGVFQCLEKTAPGEELEIAVRRAAEVCHLRTAAKRAEQLEALRMTSLAITSIFDRDELLRTIIEAAVDLLEAESGGIYEYNPERGELTIIADYQRPPHLLGTTLKVGEGAAGLLVKNGQPFMIVDDYNNWEGRAAVYSDHRPFGAVLEVPLLWRESVIGVLSIDDRTGRKFSGHEANLLKLFADQAAIALVSSNLAQRNEARRRKLQQLAEATREIMAAIRTQSLDELLEPIARSLVAITDAEIADVLLVRRPGFLQWQAGVGHRPDFIRPGTEFEIASGDRTGLTGHIAHEGQLVNMHGDDLVHHFAVRGEGPMSPSRKCYSLLAIPLKKRSEGQDVVGLLRAENKKGTAGMPHPSFSFTDEDEEVIKIFAEAVVVALELAEQKDLLNRLIESSPDGIIAINQQGSVTLFNEQAQRVLGYSKEEVLGTYVGLLYAENSEPRRIGHLLHGRKDGRLFNYKTEIKSKSGEIIPVHNSSTWLYNSRGERTGSVAYFQDLRSLLLVEKRLETLLEASSIVARAQSLPEGLIRLTEMLASLLPHTFCRILLWDEAGECLEVKAAHVCEKLSDPQPLRTALSWRMEIAKWPGLERMLERGTPQLLRTTRALDVPTLQRLSRWLGLAQDLQHLLAAPLRLAQKTIGLIELGEVEKDRPISQAEIDFASQIATNITALVDRMRLSEDAERRGQLLGALVDASQTMLGERETSKLLQQIIRLAAELIGCTAGGLFENRPHLEELELTASYEIPDQTAWRQHGRSQTHHEGLVGAAASSGEICVDRHYNTSVKRDPLFVELPFETAAAVPLKISKDVEAVLFIADQTGHQQFGAATLDILGRFAVQASIALHLSRLMTPEARSFRHLKLLHELSDYIQQADDLDKLLHVVLTGITASYGLGFNRAALFLYDEPREQLVGRMGIGHLDRATARQDWEAGRQRGLEQFSVYLKILDSGELPETPVALAIHDLVLPLRQEELDPLSRVVITRLQELLPTERLDELPEEFLVAFQPSSELLVVPLEARGQILGVLVADNKINSLPITQDDVETLLTFVTTAAIVIDKHRLLQETQIARERLQACFQASNAVVSSQEPEQVLRNILEKTPGIEEENVWVKLILVDELGKIQKQLVAGTPERPELLRTHLRLDGYTMRVMRTGKPAVIEDRAKLVLPEKSSFMEANGIAASVALPFLLHGHPIGVMWINYERPRRFEPFEIAALQLYVNQSAMAYDSARRMDDLKRLHAAARAISNAHNLHDVLHAIVHQAIHVCSAEMAVLWPYDAERMTFVTAEAIAVGVTPNDYQFLREVESAMGDLSGVAGDVGWIAVPDVLDPHFLPAAIQEVGDALRQAGIASFQAVALSAGEELLGSLYLCYHGIRSFGEQDRRTLEAFARHAALSLKNTRLFDQIHKAKQAAELVARVTTLERRDNTLQTIAETVLEAVDCSAVVLFSYAEREDRWSYPPAHSGVLYPEKAWPQGEEKTLSRSVVPKVLRLSVPHIAEEVDKSDLLKGSRFAQDEAIVSCVAIPLQAAGRKVGVMFVNYRNHHRFTPENLRDIELFAHQAAVAILNAQLFEALEKDQLRALQEFQHQIRGPIFQVSSRLQRFLAALPPDAPRRGELEMIAALSAKAKRVSTYIQLYALLSRGETITAREAEIEMSDLVQLLRDGALHASLTTNLDLECTWVIDQTSIGASGAERLLADRNLVEHAFNNVLENAFKYSFPNTEIRITGSRDPNGDLRITFANHGIPILPQETEKCVQRGWQSSQAKLFGSEGQGIGLWIVDHIMRSLSGKLDIHPTTNEGETRVSLVFPANRLCGKP